jgi:hypothetical protein
MRNGAYGLRGPSKPAYGKATSVRMQMLSLKKIRMRAHGLIGGLSRGKLPPG